MQYEPTKAKKYNKINIQKENTMNIIKVWTKNSKARQTLKTVKAEHKAQIKQLKSDIHKHKLLIKQAKIIFRLTK